MALSLRICTTVFAASVLASGTFAQKAGIGLKGGPLASRTPTELLRTTWTPGLTGGVYLPWGVGPKMEIQPEILISAMGSGFIEPDDDRYSIRSIYLQIPVSFKLYFSNTMNIHAGLQASRLIQAQRVAGDDRRDFTDRMNRMDYGLIGGLGADLRRGLDFTVRYINGMTPVLSNDQVLFPKNQAVSLTVGYRMTQMSVAGKSRRRR